MSYDYLIIEYEDIEVKELPLQYGFKGLYKNGKIIIEKALSQTEKRCILAEELGHHFTTVGNIIDQSTIINRKKEKTARKWAYVKLLPISSIVKAYENGCQNQYEAAAFLDVTEAFFEECLKRYREIYGIEIRYMDYIINLDSLKVTKKY